MRSDVQLALGPCPGDKAARQVKCGPVEQRKMKTKADCELKDRHLGLPTIHQIEFTGVKLRVFYGLGNQPLCYSTIFIPDYVKLHLEAFFLPVMREK